MWAFIVGQGSQNPLVVNDQAIVRQLHEGIVGECPFDRGPVSVKERQQVRIAHVSGGYPEQLRRASMDQEGIDEIAVFGDNDPAVPAGTGWPRVLTHPRLPQIRTCGITASGSSIEQTLRDIVAMNDTCRR